MRILICDSNGIETRDRFDTFFVCTSHDTIDFDISFRVGLG